MSQPKSLGRDLSIDYLRTTLTLLVIAHHSALAYTTFARFDPVHVFWSTAPVVDNSRWLFLDYAENFNDVFFMSLMFFVSGLFVHASLRRHGTGAFLRERLLRLGLPFAGAVLLLMPLAYYPSSLLSTQPQGFWKYYQQLAHHGFPAGPPWFIWVLLVFDLLLALLINPFVERLVAHRPNLARADRPIRAFLVALLASLAAYLPLLARYGFGTWTNIFTAPFSFQISRIGLYALWFLLGYFVGRNGIGSGLLARDGRLARHWPWWVLNCIVLYNVLWFCPPLLNFHGLAALQPVVWVASCTASCFGLLALFRGLPICPHSWMLSLNRSAYTMYLVHYLFVTWTQWALLPIRWNAGFKFAVVFATATLCSWLTAQLLLRIPGIRTVI